MLGIAEVYRSGATADSDAAMDAAEARRLQITGRFSDCSHQMQVQLGKGYVEDPRFAATYEAIERGLTARVRDAIHANAERVPACQHSTAPGDAGASTSRHHRDQVQPDRRWPRRPAGNGTYDRERDAAHRRSAHRR